MGSASGFKPPAVKLSRSVLKKPFRAVPFQPCPFFTADKKTRATEPMGAHLTGRSLKQNQINIHHRHGKEEAVDAIEHAAVARYERRRIFNPGAALEQRL